MELVRKRWTIGGGLTGIILLALTLWKRKEFFAMETYGRVLFACTLASAVLAGIFLSIRMGVRKGAPVTLKKVSLAHVWSALVFLASPLLIFIAVERLNGNFILSLKDYNYLDNYVIYLLLFLLIFALSGSLKLPSYILVPVLLAFGISNMYIKEFKGQPLLPMDLKSLKTALTVAGTYEYKVSADMIFAIVLSVLIIAMAVHNMALPKGKVKNAIRVLALLVPVGFSGVFYGTDIFVKMGYKPDFFNENRGFERKGAFFEFTMNTKYLWVSAPDGYDASEIEALVKEGAADYAPILEEGKKGVKPNIIVIMDESYSDLRAVGDFKTNQEVMPFIDSLTGQENVIEGNAYTSILGTGTSNTEYEVLTGNTMAYLPQGSNAYQIYVKDRQPSLADTLKAQGYYTTAFHPYFRSNWKRDSVYDAMGFDKYISMETLFGKKLVKEYQEDGNQVYTLRKLLEAKYPDMDVDDILYRFYVSDEYDFKMVEEAYEKRDKDQPFFMFNVTMQNHSPYTFSSTLADVNVNGSQDEYPATVQYLSEVKQTDEAFRHLVEYFKQQEEPTIILFFGDHQPNIEEGFVEKVAGTHPDNMTDEELQKRYQTRFVLWANYDIPEGHMDAISMNYLQALLLETAGLELPDYQKMLSGLYQKVPVLTAAGCRLKDGTYFKALEPGDILEEIRVSLSNYRKIAYNNTFGKEQLAEDVFLP